MGIWLESPEWLLLLLALPAVVGVPLLLRSLAGLHGVRRWTALTLRALVMALLVLCLAGPHWTSRTDKVSVVYVLDRSDSIPADQWSAALRFIEQSLDVDQKQPDDRAGIITFAGQADIEQVPVTGQGVPPMSRTPDRPGQTDLAQAMRLAASIFPPDSAKRIIVLSDGNQTVGDVEAEARRLAAAGIGIDVVPLDYTHEREIQVANLWAPPMARPGDEVPLKITVLSQAATEADLILTDNGVPITTDAAGTPQAVRVSLQPGKNALVQPVHMASGTSLHRFQVEVRPVRPQDDSIPQNNRASAFTVLSGKGKVLLVSAKRPNDAAFEQALRDDGIEVVSVGPEETPASPEEYAGFSAVVLSNVPADMIPRPTQEALALYVRNLGGGLVMIGGDQSFGAGDYYRTPIEEVLPVRCDFKRKTEEPSVGLVLVIDRSGSMAGEKIELAKKAAQAAIQALGSQDTAGVIAFDDGADVICPMHPIRDKQLILQRIGQIGSGGGTSLEPGLTLARQMLLGTPAQVKHVIALTDGQSNPADFAAIASSMLKSRITVSTVAVGQDADVALLQNIAGWGGGRFHHAPDPKSLPQIYLKEIRKISQSLLYEKPFVVHKGGSSSLTGNLDSPGIPRLEGMVLTTPKPLAEVPLLSLTEAGRVPLLANWQIGLGRSVAFTSGMWPQWGPRWLAWERFAPFWCQTVRWVMRKDGPAELDVQARIDEGAGKVVIDAVDKSAGYINFLEVAGTVISPDLQAMPIQVVQTGPGRYEATFPADAAGSYIIGLQYRNGNDVGFVQTGVTSSYSPEYAGLQANLMLLETLADIGRGQVFPLTFDPKVHNVFRRDLPAAQTRDPLWPKLLAMALVLFLLDVAVRRIAIDPRAVLGEVREWLAGLAGRWRGRDDRESLGSLKQRRQQVQEAWREKLKETASGRSKADSRRKVAANASDSPPSSIADGIESVMAAPDAADQTPPREDPAEQDNPTSRLLRAKKRAQRKME